MSQTPDNQTKTAANRTSHTLLAFRCPVSLADALAAKAARCDTSMSALIRQFIKSWFAVRLTLPRVQAGMPPPENVHFPHVRQPAPALRALPSGKKRCAGCS